MNTFDLIYAKSSTFGRDLFHHLVPGTMLLFVLAVPWMFQWAALTDTLGELFDHSGWRSATVSLVAVIVAYALGHVVMSIGYLFRALWLRTLSSTRPVVRLREAEGKLRELTKKSNPEIAKSLPTERDAHLYCETATFKRNSELHAKFIERYNTLAHLRLGLASSLFVGGLLDVILGIAAIWIDALSLWALWFGAVVLGLSLLLLRQQIITSTNFLNRVSVAFQVAMDHHA